MKMAHVSIFSKCIDESVAFYQDIVGLNIVVDMRANVAHPIVFLANAAGETCVEIIGEPESAYQGSGISMGFETEDVEAKRAEMEAAGYKPGPMISPNPFTKFFFIQDPNGVGIQFIQQDR
ncbi:MAG: VOC family protein [Eubacterium sp.]|nr:VOC family protein [Eubacterium sp.]